MAIPGLAPGGCGIPDWGIVLIPMPFGIWPLTGAPPGTPCIGGRPWLAPTPGGIPFGIPFGAPVPDISGLEF